LGPESYKPVVGIENQDGHRDGELSIEETTEDLGVGRTEVERDWKMARAWLRRELS
jgi:hypothetical protein